MKIQHTLLEKFNACDQIKGITKLSYDARLIEKHSYNKASLPNDASFDNFDFSASQANETLLRELYECRWVVNHKNIAFQGDPGLAKNASGMCIRPGSLKARI